MAKLGLKLNRCLILNLTFLQFLDWSLSYYVVEIKKVAIEINPFVNGIVSLTGWLGVLILKTFIMTLWYLIFRGSYNKYPSVFTIGNTVLNLFYIAVLSFMALELILKGGI